MQIQIDSREKEVAIGKILKHFDDNGVQHFRSKLYAGDYMSLANPHYVIDRKQNLQELIGNVCQQHKRFKNEIKRANELGIKICVLIEHGADIACLEDIRGWVNPRIKKSPKATKGETLYKILNTIQSVYDVEFKFCTKGETGLKIIELLKENGG
jgi:hypothetical protein